MSDLTTALDFILSNADATDLDRVIDAVKTRRKVLGQITAAAVRPGVKVTLGGLTPKYLNGLTGTVKSVQGGRCTVTLDETSTTSLRYAGQRFRIPTEHREYDLGGIPTQCAKVA